MTKNINNVATDEELHVCISKGNIKMGPIPSVSLSAYTTCRADAPCKPICYAAKIERLRPNVKNADARNLYILLKNPEQYWREVEAAIMVNHYFRFHVSGDIPNAAYLHRMVDVAKRNQHCEILCFTKKYELVNDFLDTGKELPRNLHMLFSVWPDLDCPNPHTLPEVHVIFRDGSTTAADGAKWCGGNCTECAKIGCGCWTIHEGEQLLLAEH